MSLKFRRFLYTTFILIFIVLSVFTLAYTAGYRYHFKKEKIEKSGGILLEFSPRNVEIHLNNSLKKTTKFWENSARLTDLLPGRYYLQIKKDGYHPWQKEVTITSGKINFIKNIVLFKKNASPSLVVPFSVDRFLNPSPNANLLAQKNSQIFSFSPKESLLSPLSFPSSTTSPIRWEFSKDNDKVLFISPSQKYLYNLYWKKLLPLSQITLLEKTSFWQWNPQDNDSLYFLKDTDLFVVELFTYQTILKKSKAVPSPKNILAAKVIPPYFFFLEKEKDKAILKFIPEKKQSPLVWGDFSASASFLNAPFPYLFIFEKDQQKATLIDTKNMQAILQENLNNSHWSKKIKDNYLLLFNNNYEIYTFNPQNKEKKLLLRTSQNIRQARWYPDFNHIIYATSHQLFIRDTAPESQNQYLLAEGEIKDFLPDKKGENIFLSGKINNQEGIFKLNIR